MKKWTSNLAILNFCIEGENLYHIRLRKSLLINYFLGCRASGNAPQTETHRFPCSLTVESPNVSCFTWFGWAQGHFTSLPVAENVEGCNTCFSSVRGESVGILEWKLPLLLPGPGLEPGPQWHTLAQVHCEQVLQLMHWANVASVLQKSKTFPILSDFFAVTYLHKEESNSTVSWTPLFGQIIPVLIS